MRHTNNTLFMICVVVALVMSLPSHAGNGLQKPSSRAAPLPVEVAPETRRDSVLSVSVSGSQAGGDSRGESPDYSATSFSRGDAASPTMRNFALWDDIEEFMDGGGARLADPALIDRLNYWFALPESSVFGLKPGAYNDGIIAISPVVMAAMRNHFAQEYASDKVENIDHLASVFMLAAETTSVRQGRPLDQHEVDLLWLETMLTDAFLKYKMPTKQNYARVFLAPLKSVTTGEPYYHGIQQTAFTIWHNHKGEFKDFMAGVYLHGLIHFDHVSRVILDSGVRANPRQIYASVLAHHLAGFVAHGLFKLDIIPDFQQMAAKKQLDQADADILEKLYREAILVSGKWRGIIERYKTFGNPKGPSLSAERRCQYHRESADLKIIVAELPLHLFRQLVCDDVGQFIFMSKWLNGVIQFLPKEMGAEQRTNGAVLSYLYQNDAVMGYEQENEARGTGDYFRERTSIAASRLGMTFAKEHNSFRLAGPQDAEYAELQSMINKYLVGEEAISVDEFRRQPYDANLCERISRG